MDAIDKEIQGLMTSWTEETEEQKQREAQAQREHLERVRERLRSGKWKPWGHVCPVCLRAILTLQPELVCEEGRRNGAHWWRRN
jgi:hypothetical protein